MINNHKVLVVCGPTAAGKTSLGIRLAKCFNGEIISADSRQIYKGMDIGTGKDLPVNSKLKIPAFAPSTPLRASAGKQNYQVGYYLFEKIPVWLMDVVYPNQEFSVSHYYRLAWEVIKDIWQRGKLPILVGGTGFYIQAVVDGIPTKDIPRDPSLRKSLEGKSVEELLVQLESLDSFRAASLNTSDRKNPRRLVRAIEVACWQQENRLWQPTKHEVPNSLFIGLTALYKFLYEKIDKRIEKWLGEGAEEEVKKLLEVYHWETSVLNETLGYKEWRPYFDRKYNLEEVIQRWQFNEHHYVRRQMTWFKKTKRIHWFDISKKGWEKKVEKLVTSWYTKR